MRRPDCIEAALLELSYLAPFRVGQTDCTEWAIVVVQTAALQLYRCSVDLQALPNIGADQANAKTRLVMVAHHVRSTGGSCAVGAELSGFGHSDFRGVEIWLIRTPEEGCRNCNCHERGLGFSGIDLNTGGPDNRESGIGAGAFLSSCIGRRVRIHLLVNSEQSVGFFIFD